MAVTTAVALLAALLAAAAAAPARAARCSGTTTVTAVVGSITDHDGPGDYEDDQLCVWHIKMPANSGVRHIVYRFAKLDTERFFDEVSVYEGNSTSAPLLDDYSGSLTALSAPYFEAGGDELTVVFESDYDITASGFVLEWSGVTCGGATDTGCGHAGHCFNATCVCDAGRSGALCENLVCPDTCDPPRGVCDASQRCVCAAGSFGIDCQSPHCDALTVLTARSGSLADNSAGERYRDSADCTWLIAPQPALAAGQELGITFASFGTEETFDEVVVWDGVAPHVMEQYNSTTSWRDVPADARAFLTSATASAHVIAVLSGDDPRRHRLVARSGLATLQFTTDSYITDVGFSATYEVLDCGAQACSGNGVCAHPENAAQPCACHHDRAGAHCERTDCFNACSGHGTCTANAPPAQTDAGRHCACSGGWAGPWCANCPAGAACDTGGGTATTYCVTGPTQLAAAAGTLETASGRTATYRSDATCTWRIAPSAPVDDVDGSGRVDAVTLTFDETLWGLAYEDATVNVYQGRSSAGSLVGSFTGDGDAPPPVHVVGGEAFVRFVSETANVTDVGFKIYYEAQQCATAGCSGNGVCVAGHCQCFSGWSGAGCALSSCTGTPPCGANGVCRALASGGQACECRAGSYGSDCGSSRCDGGKTVRGASGTIRDRDASAGALYLPHAECTWTIAPEWTAADGPPSARNPNETITLVFESFETERVFDTVELFNDRAERSQRIVELSGDAGVPAPVVSAPGASALVVRFDTDFSEQRAGFVAHYAASRRCPKHCSGAGACVPAADGTSHYCACAGARGGPACDEPLRAQPIDLRAGGATTGDVRGSVQRYAWRYYSFDVANSTARPAHVSVTVTAAALSPRNNASATTVYVSRGVFPTADAYELKGAAVAPGGPGAGAAETPQERALVQTLTAKRPAAGTWYVGVYGADDASFSVNVTFVCDLCHFGRCEHGMCVCDDGFEGESCGLRRTDTLFEYRHCISGGTYDGTCMGLNMTQCSIGLTLLTRDNSLALSAKLNGTRGASTELCGHPRDGDDFFASQYCLRLEDFHVNATSGASGRLEFGVFFLFWDIHEVQLIDFADAPFRGDCMGCPNDCSGNGRCVLDDDDDGDAGDAASDGSAVGKCVCSRGWTGDDCSREPADAFERCVRFAPRARDPLPALACVDVDFAACPPTLAVSVDEDGAAANATPLRNATVTLPLNATAMADACVRVGTCHVCAHADAPAVDRLYRAAGSIEVVTACGGSGDGTAADPTALVERFDVGAYERKQLDEGCARRAGISGNRVCEAGETLQTAFEDCRCEKAGRPNGVGDGWCDEENNIDCCWDGGDCCESTCRDGGRWQCGAAGYQCVDPSGDTCLTKDGQYCPSNCTSPAHGRCEANRCVCRPGWYGAACERAYTMRRCGAPHRVGGISEVCVEVDFERCAPAVRTEVLGLPGGTLSNEAVFGRLTRRTDAGAATPARPPSNACFEAGDCTVCTLFDDVRVSEPLPASPTEPWRDERRVVSGCAKVRMLCDSPAAAGDERMERFDQIVSLGCFSQGDAGDAAAAAAPADAASSADDTDPSLPRHTAPKCSFDVCGDDVCSGDETPETCMRDCGCQSLPAGVDRSHIGDGWCDEQLNVECCWDGGDCCSETCVPRVAVCGAAHEEGDEEDGDHGDGEEHDRDDAFHYPTCHNPSLTCQGCFKGCNGHGRCVPPSAPGGSSTCVCSAGWTTAHASDPCAAAVCDGGCDAAHGSCVAPGRCQCSEGFCGDSCEQRIDRCGTCNGDNSCVGCDGKTGGTQLDRCGVCGGDGSSCRNNIGSGTPSSGSIGGPSPAAQGPGSVVGPTPGDGSGAPSIATVLAIVFGVLLALCLCAWIAFLVVRRRRRQSYFKDVADADQHGGDAELRRGPAASTAGGADAAPTGRSSSSGGARRARRGTNQ